MKTGNILSSAVILLLLTAGTLTAQDSFSDFSSDSFSDTSDAGFTGDSGDSFGSFAEGGEGSSPLKIGGEIRFQSRYYTGNSSIEEAEDIQTESFPEVRLNLDYSAENSDFIADLVFSEDRMYSDYSDVIKEAYIRIYYDSFNIETGYMKVVWGKGDELKAVDILNQTDYSDFYNKDLLERKIASPMLKINKYAGINGLFELVFIPCTDYPEFDTAKWAPYDIKTLTALSAADATDISYKDHQTLDSGQIAARYTNSSSGFDYGFIYSYGFMPLPTTKLKSFTGEIPGEAEVKLERANIFGIEAAKVLMGLNSRAEFAYYMSSDIEGDDPDIQNNKIMWVFGFDKDLPISSLNFLLETQGLYTLQNSEIEKMSASNPDYDVDYDIDGTYSRNMIIARLKDSLNHDRIRPEISLTYHVEDSDFMLRPEVEFVLKDDISFDVLYTLFKGDEDTVFGVYEENSFLQAKVVYSF